MWGGSSNATGTFATTADVIVSGSMPGCGGIATTTTPDAANSATNTRTNCIDGLGRLSAVIEPTGMLTSYANDLLDNLTGVSAQCLTGHTCSPVGTTGQNRTFTYSTLSRLLSASNPESGITSYSYYNNGNLQTRTNANGTLTSISYDGLNRPMSVTYTPGSGVAATPNVTYSYDRNSLGTGFTGFVGAPSSVSSSASKMEYSYDGFGRVVQSRQTTPNGGQAYAFSSYQYSLTDQITGITYPSGRAITYTLDASDQSTAVNGTPAGGGTPTPYASGITYTAAGNFLTVPFGNGVTETHSWNSLFQHIGIQAGGLLALTYNYCGNGQSQCSSGNTGSPWQQTIAVGGQVQAVQEYVHDSLNRLIVASERSLSTSFNPVCPDSGSVWCRQFSYDNSGNRTVTARTPPGTDSWDVGTFDSKNRILDTGWGYDLAGNVTKSPTSPKIGYDAENGMVSFCSATDQSGNCTAQTQYVYDGLGNRVQAIGQNGTTTYVYDAFGNLAVEYEPVASVPAGATQYVTVDTLGSTRLVMEGAQATERHDFQPYGYEIDAASGTWRMTVPGYGTDTVRQKFTGQERDSGTGLDFFPSPIL